MARWSRAIRLLPADARRVLDLGCAFGFTTRRLPRPAEAVGVDASPTYLRRAVRAGGGPRYLRASVEAVPLRSGVCDAVLLLDVIEHVDEPAAALAEAARLLRPGGALLLSVPHAGLLRRFDSINRCPNLVDPAEIAPLRERARAPGELHRHFSEAELRALLSPWFAVDRVQRTGLGVAEFLNIGLLWLTKRLLRVPRLYDWLQYAYFTVYLAEDVLPLGRWSYHIMLRARRLDDQRPDDRAAVGVGSAPTRESD